MDIREALLAEHSKRQTKAIFDFIGDDPQRLKELMKCFLYDTYRVSQRASWVVGNFAEKYPSEFKKFLPDILENLDKSGHDAIKRNTFRLLQFVELPDELLGEIADKSYKYFTDTNQAIAIRVFAMTVLGRVCEKEPELSSELRDIIESRLAVEGPGYRSRGRVILKKLEKLSVK